MAADFRLPLLALCVAAFLFLLLSLLAPVPYFEAVTIGTHARNFADLSARFEGLAEKRGAVYAFEVLKRALLPPQTDLHLLGHVVGDGLYRQKGIGGIADCTQDFRNACSHAIVIGALNEFGDGSSTISKIQQACHKAPGGVGAYTMCMHGLGHGVFAYYGYDLKKTVDFCYRAGDPAYGANDSAQCVGGAIMELVGGGGHDHDKWLAAQPEYFDPADPLSPCMSTLIPESAKGMCLDYLTPRLFQAAGADLAEPEPAFFPNAFAYCDAIPKAKQHLRNSCFGGFGKEFIPLVGARDIRAVDHFSDDEYRLTATWCMLSEAGDGKDACITQALATVFWGGENDAFASLRFCSDTPIPLSRACYQELARNIRVYFDGSKRVQWCQKLPQEFQDGCTTDAPTSKTEL